MNENMQFKTWPFKISDFLMPDFLSHFMEGIHKRFQGRWQPLVHDVYFGAIVLWNYVNGDDHVCYM